MTFLVATKTRLPPRPWAFMTWSAARVTRKWPVALTAKLRSQSASAMRSMAAAWAMPAFDTTMSRPPYASTVAATAASTEASDVTSAAEPERARRPRVRRRLLGHAPGARLVQARHHHAGSSLASRRATARPMPLAPPVTSATRRASSFSGGAIWSL